MNEENFVFNDEEESFFDECQFEYMITGASDYQQEMVEKECRNNKSYQELDEKIQFLIEKKINEIKQKTNNKEKENSNYEKKNNKKNRIKKKKNKKKKKIAEKEDRKNKNNDTIE